jgi:hypothetical protein
MENTEVKLKGTPNWKNGKITLDITPNWQNVHRLLCSFKKNDPKGFEKFVHEMSYEDSVELDKLFQLAIQKGWNK